jgi:hypothetical protein
VHMTSVDTVLEMTSTQDQEYEVIAARQRESSAESNRGRQSRRISRPSALALPKDTAFQIFVPYLKGAKITFEIEFEDINTGKGTLVGGCAFSLEDVAGPLTKLKAPDVKKLFAQKPAELPLHIVNAEACQAWQVHHGSIAVAVSVNQHPAGQSSKLPPLSPFIPHSKAADFVNNSMLSSSRNHQHDSLKGSSNRLSTSSTSTGSDDGNSGVQDCTASPESQSPLRRPSRRISLIQQASSVDYESDDSDEEGGITVDVLAPPNASPVASPVFSSKHVADAGDNSVPIINMRNEDTSQLLTDCYEFMWHLGFKGTDPLLIDRDEDIMKPSNIDVSEMKESIDEAVISLNNVNLSEIPCAEGNLSGHQQTKRSLKDRVDVSYSQEFLWDYVFKLQNMFSHLLMLISACEEEVGDGNTFRPSRLKKEIEFQPLPINFHYQVMTVQSCSAADRVKDKESTAGFWVNPPNTNPIIVWDSVTCGSFSAHACPHKKGGLTRILSEIGNDKDALSKHKAEYVNRVLKRRGSITSARPRSVESTKSIDVPSWKDAFAPNGSEANRRQALINETENYETSILNTILRRMYGVSQALSVAVNSFIMKLELVVENYVHPTFIERWMSHGFLIVHECLLSVSGKERAMIEDTWMAIETLKNFTIRLLPSPQDDQYRQSNSWLAENCNTSSSNRKIQSSSWWNSICNDGRADVYLVGREVQVFIPREIVEQLPGKVRSVVETEGCVFNFVPILFSQGIDIMQTLATTWDSNDDIGDFQLHINYKGFERLNSYCEAVQPCSSSSEASSFQSKSFVPHPLTSQLLELVRTTDVSQKNVQMLIEVERICSMIGGCRVTFCKSGKDRTGMAITLEQSRLLGEVFATGTSDERIIRDADVMRIHGTRIMIAEKNIGKPVYSINLLQVKFLPLFYRPPLSVTEKLIKSGDNS